jgi:hypothetical protein
LVLFLSDPFFNGPSGEFYSGPGALMHPDGRPVFGYTVREVLPAVIEELDIAFGEAAVAGELVVRAHPSEHPGPLKSILRLTRQTHLRARLGAPGPLAPWIRGADVVVGMMTIALLHAALAGRPALSVQPGLLSSGEPDPCVSNELGYTRGIFDRAALRRACQQIARQEWAALKSNVTSPLPLDGAAARVADVLSAVARGVGSSC